MVVSIHMVFFPIGCGVAACLIIKPFLIFFWYLFGGCTWLLLFHVSSMERLGTLQNFLGRFVFFSLLICSMLAIWIERKNEVIYRWRNSTTHTTPIYSWVTCEFVLYCWRGFPKKKLQNWRPFPTLHSFNYRVFSKGFPGLMILSSPVRYGETSVTHTPFEGFGRLHKRH